MFSKASSPSNQAVAAYFPDHVVYRAEHLAPNVASALAAKCSQITLDVDRLDCDSAEALEVMKGELSVRVRHYQEVTAALAFILLNHSLTSLELDRSQIAGNSLPTLALIPTLRRLALSDDRITKESAAHLKGCPSLTSLSLSSCAVSDESAIKILGNPKITTLNLSDNFITDAAAEAFRDAPSLTSLDIRSAHMSGIGISTIAKNVHLESLFLSFPTDREYLQGAISLAKSTTLTELNCGVIIPRCYDALDALMRSSSLQRFTFFGTERIMSARASATLASCASLTELNLYTHLRDWKIDPPEMLVIARINSLTALTLSNVAMTNSALTALTTCASLERLSLLSLREPKKERDLSKAITTLAVTQLRELTIHGPSQDIINENALRALSQSLYLSKLTLRHCTASAPQSICKIFSRNRMLLSIDISGSPRGFSHALVTRNQRYRRIWSIVSVAIALKRVHLNSYPNSHVSTCLSTLLSPNGMLSLFLS